MLDQDNMLENSDDIFSEAERALQLKIPPTLKNILIINGYENEGIIASISQTNLEEIESYCRNDLHLILQKDEYQKYYGPYHKNPELFKLVSGHKNVIMTLSNYFKQKIQQRIQNIESTATVSTVTQKSFTSSSSTSCSSPHAVINTSAENTQILTTLRLWSKSKASITTWVSLKKDFDNIKANTYLTVDDKIFCNIKCFCGTTYKIPKLSRTSTGSKRWIYSNFQTHLLKKHLASSTLIIPKTLKCQSITSFMTKSISESISKERKINILQNIKIPANPAISNNMDSQKEEDTKMIKMQEELPREYNEENKMLRYSNSSTTVAVKEMQLPSSSSYNSSEFVKEKVSKWKSEKYQRSERAKRARENQGETLQIDQSLITDYFVLAEKVTDEVNKNLDSATRMLSHIDDHIEDLDAVSKNKDKRGKINIFLQKLLDISLKNSKSSMNRNSYDEAIKKFSIYLFYIGGRMLYETLHVNLHNVLPSVSTLNRYLENNREQLQEGEFDFHGLSQYLEERNLAKVIWISEDGTRITGKVQYDSKSNKILGFVLPLKEGIPQKNTYIASSASTIESFFKTAVKANYAYSIMAQPLSMNVPPFCLALFGTDNRFDFRAVLGRWNFMKKKASEYGITIVGFSSDGDTRLLKAMRIKSSLPDQTTSSNSSEWPWFQSDLQINEENYIQDTVHIITKLRTRLLKPGILLPIGNYTASVSHLQDLILNTTKDKHLLTAYDLKPEDKMNYLSAEKMCSMLVMDQLKCIPDSDGTIAYLKVMNYILSSFLDTTLDLGKRVYYIWYGVFFLRIWRAWVRKSQTYTLKDNFLSSNCYLCIELNAHEIIKLILRIQKGELDSRIFYTPYFSSQPCEKLFRTARSMTSTFSTVINFSIKDLLHRVDRIRTLNATTNDLSGIFLFPRENKLNSKKPLELTNEEIKNFDITCTIEKALSDALTHTEHLGIVCNNESDWLLIDIPVIECDPIDNEDHEDEVETEIDSTPTNDVLQDDDPIIDLDNSLHKSEDTLVSLDLKDYSDRTSTITESSPFLNVQLKNKSMIIKKSTYCWLLEECEGKVSNDRLRRFFSNKKTDNTINNKTHFKRPTIKRNKKYGKNVLFKKEKKLKTELKISDKSSSESSLDKVIEYADSTDTETFSSSKSSSDEGSGNCSKVDTSTDNIYNIDDFVIVELLSEKGRKNKFIGKLKSINPFNCSFLRPHSKICHAFVYPKIVDEAVVKPREFVVKLPPPTVLRRGEFQFDKNILEKHFYPTNY